MMRRSAPLAFFAALFLARTAAAQQADPNQPQNPFPQIPIPQIPGFNAPVQGQQAPQQQPQQPGQYPQQPGQYPQQPGQYPQQPGQYPQQQGQYPQQPGQYPQQQGPYPQQQGQYPQQQPQQPGWQPNWQQGGGGGWQNNAPPQVAPAIPPSKQKRSADEASVLYAAGAGYGIGTGIWIDALAGVKNPGTAIIAPIVGGTAGFFGVYAWDKNTTLYRGVPSSTALGVALGTSYGASLGLMQLANSDRGNHWSFATNATVSWVFATGGAVGGYAFGEFFRPDPRAAAFIGTGSGMLLTSGLLVGLGAGGTAFRSSETRQTAQAGSVTSFVALNLGIVGIGALATQWTPSFQTQKYIAYGYGAGTVGGTVLGLALGAAGKDSQKGLIVGGLGGLAGGAIAGALTSDLLDDADGNVTRSGALKNVHFSLAPVQGGATASAYGVF
jgi:hypothetical protein